MEVIEDYPQDKYAPSGLLLGFTRAGRAMHLQVSFAESDTTKIITIYEPDPNEWIYRANKRPDILIAHDMADNTTVIELKRPTHTIDRDDEAQAIKYRDDLQNTLQRINILLIGKGKVTAMNSVNERENITILSYAELIAIARKRVMWLIRELKLAES